MLLKINKFKESHISKAFTIVELLVVIVIIGILAAITIVSYSGINRRAIAVSLTSDLSSDAKLLKLYNVDHSVYPDSIDTNYCPNAPEADSQYCLKASNGNELTYTGGGQSFILTDTNTATNISYQITENGIATIVEAGGGGSGVKTFANAWGGTGFDQMSAIVKDSDGSYTVAGMEDSFGAGGEDIFLSKYSNVGDLIWNKTWGGAGEENVSTMIATSDNGYMIAGNTCSYGAGYCDVILIKYDSNGAVEWNNTWGETKVGSGDEYPYSIIQSSDGNYVIVGSTVSFGAGNKDGFILKVSSTDGSTIWNKTWGGAANDEYMSVVQLSDGTYIAVGNTYSYASGNADMVIAKYNSDGSIAWNKTWGGTGRDNAKKIIKLSGDSFVIVGCEDVSGAGSVNAYIAKYTSDGNLVWNQSFGETGMDFAESVAQTSDGGFNVVGETDSFSNGTYKSDSLLVRFDASGTYKWSRIFGGSDDDVAMDIAITPDDGYMVVGYAGSFGVGGTDAYIMRYKPDGSVNYCQTTKCQSVNIITSNPSGTVNNPTVTVYTPSASNSNPSATKTSTLGTVTTIVPKDPYPTPTIVFSAQEIYIAYPGDDLSACKQWTAPNGKQIYGFYVNHATEAGYDFFAISVDGTEKYNKSGLVSDEYVDVSSAPGTTLDVCFTSDGGTQEGFGGEVTGVYYK